MGVVVTQSRGSSPRRSPNSRLSRAIGYRNAASSSSQAQSDCGPRSRSGSSALKVVATAPLGQVSRRFEGSYRGRSQGGQTARSPLGPSTITSRTSAAVAPTRAIRRDAPVSTRCRIHSAAHRVLPNPRPSEHQPGPPVAGGRALRRPRAGMLPAVAGRQPARAARGVPVETGRLGRSVAGRPRRRSSRQSSPAPSASSPRGRTPSRASNRAQASSYRPPAPSGSPRCSAGRPQQRLHRRHGRVAAAGCRAATASIGSAWPPARRAGRRAAGQALAQSPLGQAGVGIAGFASGRVLAAGRRMPGRARQRPPRPQAPGPYLQDAAGLQGRECTYRGPGPPAARNRRPGRRMGPIGKNPEIVHRRDALPAPLDAGGGAGAL